MITAEEFETARKELRCLKKSAVLQLGTISQCVTLLLGLDSEMAFSHMGYQGFGNVTRVHQRTRGFFRCPGSEDSVEHHNFSWERNIP